MGYLYAILASLLFGLNGSTTKVIVEAGVTPAQLTFARVTIIAVVAGVVLLIKNRHAFRITRRQLLVMAGLGLFGVALVQWFYATAISLLPVGIALMLEYSGVLMVAMAARFVFQEQVKARIWVAIGAVLVGMALVAQIWASPLSGLGVIVGLLAAVCLAVYFLVGERQVASTSPLAVLFWSMLFASAFWFFFSAWWQFDPMLLVSRTSLGGSLESVSLPLWLLLLWNGLIGSFMPYLLSYLALATLSATGAGIVSTSEVIFAFAFAYLWLSESLDVIQMLGVLIVLTGIVLAQTARAGQTLDLDLARRDPPVTKQH